MSMEFLYTPYYVDTRMSAQSSYFMVWGADPIALENIFTPEMYCMQFKENTNGRVYGDHEHNALSFALYIHADRKQTLMRELDSVGKIPENFELISFDQPYTPGVSYICQDEEQIAKKAVDLLLSQIGGSPEPSQIRVPPDFIDISKIDEQERIFHMLYVLNRGAFSV